MTGKVCKDCGSPETYRNRNTCRKCQSRRALERHKLRYATEPEYRERFRQARKRYLKSDKPGAIRSREKHRRKLVEYQAEQRRLHKELEIEFGKDVITEAAIEEYLEKLKKDENMSRLEQAHKFAFDKHDGQTRRYDGEPYINHPERVEELVRAWGEEDEDVLIACLLHDTVEDCGVAYEEITRLFGPRVCSFVYYLTKDIQVSKGTATTKEEASAAMFKKLREAPLPVLVVKCADRIDNLISYPPGKLPQRYLTESNELLSLITKRMNGPSEVLSRAHVELQKAIWANQFKIGSD